MRPLLLRLSPLLRRCGARSSTNPLLPPPPPPPPPQEDLLLSAGAAVSVLDSEAAVVAAGLKPKHAGKPLFRVATSRQARAPACGAPHTQRARV